ncbi:uncharacterized protein GIQ15_04134 [Arthroderma uncinatum]|uniref:uncharacterized protein n=1 Tax=Arthroderma uncinatum TaxID=74035 RepID=UPI00144ABF05|nr:uncharacterized protein GIQ15_04134 [Arthroderma uncinatum]KAF3481375.1 hypothetical protein GIQ15_04134 [Arthroderma uncinatum]
MALRNGPQEGKPTQKIPKPQPPSRDGQRVPSPCKRASDADIDMLLAEGKAAAAAAASKNGSSQRTGDTPNEPRSNNNVPIPTVPLTQPKRKSVDSAERPSTSAITITRDKEVASLPQRPPELAKSCGISQSKIQTPSPKEEKNPPAEVQPIPAPVSPFQKPEATDDDDIKPTLHLLPSTPQSKCLVEHEFQNLSPQELQDLRDWLLFTRYYDENYRNNKIRRHRRLAALDEERAELIKEEQSERQAFSGGADFILPQPWLAQVVVTDPSPLLNDGVQSARNPITCSSPALPSWPASQISANTERASFAATPNCTNANENIDHKPLTEGYSRPTQPAQPTQTQKRDRPYPPGGDESRRKISRGDLSEDRGSARYYESQGSFPKISKMSLLRASPI